jgi:hypothetical protein
MAAVVVAEQESAGNGRGNPDRDIIPMPLRRG